MKKIVIKMGGALVKELHCSFIDNIRRLKEEGYGILLVHGGGEEIDSYSQQLGCSAQKIDGIRVTDDKNMDVVSMVLNGLINKRLTSYLEWAGIHAIGLSGVDHHIIQAEELDEKRYGKVGKVIQVKEGLLNHLLNDFVVVFSPVGVGRDGQLLNINGDTAAGALAKAIQAEGLILATDVDGILKESKVQKCVKKEDVINQLKDGTIYGGMIPKIQSALHALEGGVKAVTITNGKKEFIDPTGEWKGTRIVKEESIHVI